MTANTRYQLQATDDNQQVATINSGYLEKLKILAQCLADRGFKGRIFDIEEGSMVYSFSKQDTKELLRQPRGTDNDS